MREYSRLQKTDFVIVAHLTFVGHVVAPAIKATIGHR
jgi:hypothetical protein